MIYTDIAENDENNTNALTNFCIHKIRRCTRNRTESGNLESENGNKKETNGKVRTYERVVKVASSE